MSPSDTEIQDGLPSRAGFQTWERIKIRQLAEIAERDPLEFARMKNQAAADLEISVFDLDRLVQEKRREHARQEKAPKLAGLKILSAANLTLNDIKTDWLIYGVKEKDTLAIVYGESGSKKSFTVLDQLFSIAAGISYHGRKVSQGATLYIPGEGGKGLAKRAIGLAHHLGISLEGLPFFYANRAVEFLNPDSVAELRPLMNEIAKEQNLVAVAIDTLSRCFGPGDENSNRDMAAFVSELDKLRTEFGCAIDVIHHNGNSDKERERGAYALRAAADWRWLVSQDATGIIRLTCKKAKDFEEPPPIAFKAEQVHIPGQFDDDGKPVTTLVLHEVAAPQIQAKSKKLSAGNRLALSALQTITRGQKQVHLDEWRAEAYATSTADTQEAKRKAFERARKELVANGSVNCRNDHYWIPQTDPDKTRQCPAVSGDDPDRTGHIPLGMSGLSAQTRY